MIENEKDISELVVIKSNPILDAKNELSKQQMRLFNLYLAFINPLDPTTKSIRFSLSEFSRLLNKELSPSAIKKAAKDMLSLTIDLTPITYADEIKEEGEKSFYNHLVTMWNEFDCRKNKDGYWEVTIEANEKMIPYLFNIKSLGYGNFKLLYSYSLKSDNSMKLYEQCVRFKKVGIFEIKVEELLKRLGLTDKKTYQQYKDLNRNVLKPCSKDINEKTDIKVEYTTRRKRQKGSPVESIIFTVKRNRKNEIVKEDNIIDLEDIDDTITEEIEPQPDNSSQSYIRYIEKELNLSRKDATTIVSYKGIYHITDDKFLDFVEYILSMKPQNPVGYFITAMKENYDLTQKDKKNDFQKFSQRNYSQMELADLEKQLLMR